MRLRDVAVVGAMLLAACGAPSHDESDDDKRVSGGDAVRGRAVLATGAHGCAACHTIPGVRFPRGVAGPPLEGMKNRAFIAGQLPNTADVLVTFLQDPPSLVPGTGMPDVHMSLEDARDVAAYLYSLEGPDGP